MWYKDRYGLAISDDRLKNVTLEEIYLDIAMTLLHKDGGDIEDYKGMSASELDAELTYGLDPSEEAWETMQDEITQQLKDSGVYEDILKVMENLPADG